MPRYYYTYTSKIQLNDFLNHQILLWIFKKELLWTKNIFFTYSIVDITELIKGMTYNRIDL